MRDIKDLKGDTLFILDGTALLYKCFYGLGKQKYFADLMTQTRLSDTLSSEDDRQISSTPCGAVAALAVTFTRFCRDVKPCYVVVVFDAGRQTFRNRMYAPYKQQRPEVRCVLLLDDTVDCADCDI
jgi:5'-3' exonuclease